ncbi:putative periplasmic lipoprotein, OsmY-like [Sulfurospirillum halorespirans DSM 13726]|uniref:Putative periplasmic lipoprotein, OsmY-like n=2 Tax=Sulfurospirillum halorespirans TaxID=194424 RepID=A0A1D7TJ53_9BACT|nr:putative periplasmic lipoprotein, OsmY-like [Sulfurospirillum halorespirans DSM 13726]
MKYSFIAAAIVAVILSTSISAYASDMDDQIESSFKKSFVFKTYLKDEHIKIASKEGVVTLSGEVFDDAHKPMAGNTAEAITGVKSVDNQIVIREDRLPENSDTWIRMKVQTALVFHSNVSASKTEVSVKNGVVTLKGEAESSAKKELTTQYAKKVEGVKSVINNMKLSKSETMGEKIDDASITAQVKMTLLLHSSTSAIRTSVTTKDGVAMVSGKAQNAAEVDLVTKLVEDVDGVIGVVNTMSIDASLKN